MRWRIIDRPHELNAPQHIAIHPVSAGQERALLHALAKTEDARMFQEAADDRAHADVVGAASDLGRQHAGAANDQVDAYIAPTSLDQCSDQRLVGTR